MFFCQRWGTEFSPICLTPDVDLQADSYVGTMFCNHFGFARLLFAEPLVLPKKAAPSSATKFYTISPQAAAAATGDPSRHFIPVKQCESGSVLRIHCTEMMCEPRLHRNKGVVVTENGELVLKRQEQFFPFVVQIYKRVWSSWVLRCGGVIVHPLWLITSSGCIDKYVVIVAKFPTTHQPLSIQSLRTHKFHCMKVTVVPIILT